MILIACAVVNCLCYTCCIVDSLLDVLSIVFPVEYIKHKISNTMSEFGEYLRIKGLQDDSCLWLPLRR